MTRGLELSFCLIVKNEEPYLRRCVESFGAIYDELIIVDTGSTDGTCDVARDLLRDRAGRLEHHPWRDDFSDARNHACSFARGAWILMVDADEYLEPGTRPQAVLEEVRRAPPDVLNLLLVDLTLLDGTYVMAHPVNRLFRNHPDVRWVGRIHETLSVTAAQQRLTPLRLVHDNALKRGRRQRLPQDVSSMYVRGLEADLAHDPDASRHHFYLANTLAEREDWAGALREYERYLELTSAPGWAGWPEERFHAHLHAAACRRRLPDLEGARRVLLDALALEPLRAEVYLELGDIALERGRLEEARHWYTVAAGVPRPSMGLLLDTHAYGGKPWWKLGTALIRLGDHRSALIATERAASYSPDDPAVRERAAQLALAVAADEAAPTVVIPSRSPERVARCLEAVVASDGAVFHEVVVVCDGDPAPFAPLAERFPRVRLLAGPRPFVFSRSVNLAIAACRGDVVLLNDDALPTRPGWLDALAGAARRPGAGPVSPLLSRCDNPLQDARRGVEPGVVRPAGAVTFTCVYLSRALLDAVGPLDEGLVWYGWEDNDYCRRSQAAGRTPLVVADVVVLHDEPSATYGEARRARRATQARHYFHAKDRPVPPPCDVLVVARRATTRADDVARLLARTRGDCRILLALEVGDGDEAWADELLDLVDPRLTVRFVRGPGAEAALLDELARGAAEVVAHVAPGALPPDGWLQSLLRARPLESASLGVIALADGRRPAPAQAPRLRVGAAPVLQVDAATIAGAAAWLAARAAVEDFGPLAGDAAPWGALVDRLARHGRVSGLLEDVVAEPAGGAA